MANNKFIVVLFLLIIISPSLFSHHVAAGRSSKVLNKFSGVLDTTNKDMSRKLSEDETEKIESIHERVLRVNTKDYGTGDPAPALVRPPFKLIPN